MNSIKRRDFIKGSLTTAAATALYPRKSMAASNKIIIGAMGLGGRGRYLAQAFAGRPDAEIAYLCDADSRRLGAAQKTIEQAQGKPAKLVQDFRRILDDKNVDVLINATPDHWHGLGSIMACQAHKDVYVEKPMSHNLFEGTQMIAAARKYKRVIQVGMQTRSAPYMHHVREHIRSGKLGEVHMVRVYNMMRHGAVKARPDQAAPEGFDYELWTGPAPLLPYNPSRRWLNYREYSCGPIPGDAIHQLDLARFITGDTPYPNTVSHAGGINVLKDGRNCPDTQIVTYEYDKLTLLLQASLWTGYMKKTPQSVRNSDQFPDFPFSSTKIEVLGTKGYLYVGRHGGGWIAYDAEGKQIGAEYGRQADQEHQDNFIDCIRSRKQPQADVEQGHYSAALCHLAEASYRTGNRKLNFDPKTETFPNDPDANRYLRRSYRKPWVIGKTI